MSNSPSSRNQIDSRFTPIGRVVAAFESAWHSAHGGISAPRLESILDKVPRSERASYLRELLAVELQFRAKQGESPGAAEYLARFPRDADTIQAIFEECNTVAVGERSSELDADPLAAPGTLPQQPPQTGSPLVEPGTILGNYTIEKLIGQGGMGAVYQAQHRLMRRNVAIKIISQAALQHPEALERFHREVQAVARLEHPNVVTAHDADQAGDIHFLVMQYVDGADLSTMVKTHGPLSVDMALRFLVQAARGLEYAHSEGVIHRDIKPSNLIVARNGLVKILDMGLARIQQSLSESSSGDRNLTQAGNLMGTVDFMAPEQALDAKDADQRADIYSLGCTFYFLLTGRTLYSGDTLMKRIVAHRSNTIPSLRAARADVPDWVEPVFQKLVAKHRTDRYQSMTELLATITPLVASGLSSAEVEVSAKGRRGLDEGSDIPPPVPPLLVKLPDSALNKPKSIAGKTSPGTESETLVNSPVEGPLAPGAREAGTKNETAKRAAPRHEIVRIDPAEHDRADGPVPGPSAEQATWRTQRGSKDPALRIGGRSGAVNVSMFRKRRHRLLGAAALYFALVALVVGAITYALTDGGTVVIAVSDEQVQTILDKSGIPVSESKTGRAYTLKPGPNNLPTGQYQIDGSRLPPGIELDAMEFNVSRGGTQSVTVTVAGHE